MPFQVSPFTKFGSLCLSHSAVILLIGKFVLSDEALAKLSFISENDCKKKIYILTCRHRYHFYNISSLITFCPVIQNCNACLSEMIHRNPFYFIPWIICHTPKSWLCDFPLSSSSFHTKHVELPQSRAHNTTWQLVILKQLNRVCIRVTFRINVRERIGSRFVFRYLRRLMYWISLDVCALA